MKINIWYLRLPIDTWDGWYDSWFNIDSSMCQGQSTHSPTMENPQLVPSLLWRMTVLGYCNCRGSFCQNIQLGMKLEAPKLVSGPCKYKINIELGVKPMSSPTNLHYGQGNTVEADGSFEGSHSLGMSETIQTGIVHFDQQVAFLQQREPHINKHFTVQNQTTSDELCKSWQGMRTIYLFLRAWTVWKLQISTAVEKMR